MQRGIIKFFSQRKGYGFICPEDGSQDLFFHISGVSDPDLCQPDTNDVVEFELGAGKKRNSGGQHSPGTGVKVFASLTRTNTSNPRALTIFAGQATMPDSNTTNQLFSKSRVTLGRVSGFVLKGWGECNALPASFFERTNYYEQDIRPQQQQQQR